MTPRLAAGLSAMLVAAAVVFGMGWSGMPDWFGMLRTVMMILGGLVVIAIVLVVSVAIISGLIGMTGRLRSKK